jgi:hypothetical protein
MSSALIIYVIALVFLILSFVWALITREISATLFAIWAIAIVVVFSGFPWGR